jgi:hypothetical protein
MILVGHFQIRVIHVASPEFRFPGASRTEGPQGSDALPSPRPSIDCRHGHREPPRLRHRRRRRYGWRDGLGGRHAPVDFGEDDHRLVRITDFPARVDPPKRVRIYARREHFVLQFWDPAVKHTLYARVNGDLIAAIAKAREIDQQLTDLKSSGYGRSPIGHEELVTRYRQDLERRADAALIAVASVTRFRSALDHYLAFTRLPAIGAKYPSAGRAGRDFALRLSAYLESLEIAPNGRPGAPKRRMLGQDFVLDTVRAMFQWAGDAERGNCLPPGFLNPFRRQVLDRRRVAAGMFGEPDITVAMAHAFLETCDTFQLRLFAPLALLGLRAAEPIYLFHELIEHDTLHVACLEELEHATKGLQNKRLPLLPALTALLKPQATGLLYLRRAVAEGRERPKLQGASLQQVIEECSRRWQGTSSVGERLRIRRAVLDDVGALTYKQIQGEFTGLAQRLHWPAAATLKDLRHLFATCMASRRAASLSGPARTWRLRRCSW